MASAHFSLSLQQICQSCSETSLISPACSAWHSNPTYRGHAGASDGRSSAAQPTQAKTRHRPQPFQLFQQPRDTKCAPSLGELEKAVGRRQAEILSLRRHAHKDPAVACSHHTLSILSPRRLTVSETEGDFQRLSESTSQLLSASLSPGKGTGREGKKKKRRLDSLDSNDTRECARMTANQKTACGSTRVEMEIGAETGLRVRLWLWNFPGSQQK
ncbi:hypothetical protein Q7C36_017034 [Tachysurus vachellii]|uniref:Uncharacterized protein n=1 Tax=Tachysurus vachellii TaxID=175792 RepID=A0AA88S7Z4_TACVA|nr:hypothetical protein Q7C36_017034 [Tachysurus vachellii]